MQTLDNPVVKSLPHSQIQVLAKKLQLPFLPLNHIKRSALIARINERRANVRSILLESAAGYGKSLLLAELLHQKKHEHEAVAWLCLDENENDVRRFLSYLIYAINGCDECLGVSALQALEQGLAADRVFANLLADVQQFAHVLHLALDDVHHIHDKQVLAFIEQLMRHAPDHFQIYLTSRCRLPLSISDLVLQEKVWRWHEDQLAFTETETAHWLAQNMSEELSELQQQQVYGFTLGWGYGLQMWLEAYLQQGKVEVQLDRQFAHEFFSHIWPMNLTNEQRTLCGQLAILGHANGLYLDWVFERQDTQQQLDNLANQHGLLLNDTQRHSWKFLHPMLQNYLIQRQDKNYIKRMCGHAAVWLHEHDSAVLAVEMALKSNNNIQAAQILQLIAESILEKLDLIQLMQWKQQIPNEVIASSPRLIIIFSWALALSQHFDEAERLMVQMEPLLASGGYDVADEISGHLFSIRAYISRCRGNLDNALHLSAQAQNKLPPHSFVAKALNFHNLCNAQLGLGQFKQARESNRLALEAARAVGSIALEMLMLHQHANIEQSKGNLNLAHKILEEGLMLAERLPDRQRVQAYGRLLSYRGYLYFLQNQLEKAQPLLEQGAKVARLNQDAYFILAQVLLSNVARHQGQLELAYDYLAQAESQLQYWSVPAFTYRPWLSTLRSNLLMDQNKVDNALSNLKELQGLGQQNPHSLSPEHFPALKHVVNICMVRAKSLLGHNKDALRLVDKALLSKAQDQQAWVTIAHYLMRALLRQQLGQEEQALSDLRQAIALAQADNCIMPFLEFSSAMAPLIRLLPATLQQQPLVHQMVKKIEERGEGGFNQDFAKAKSIISQRELAVLELIAEGLSNQDIAERLFISLHTVKTHARRINAKLSVKNRTQAIIRAREMGIF